MTGAHDRLRALVGELTTALGPGLVVDRRRHGSLVVAGLVVDGELCAAAGVPDDLPPEDAAGLIVGTFQDAVIEHAGGEPRPPCPTRSHPHPAVLRPAATGLGWLCPAGPPGVAH